MPNHSWNFTSCHTLKKIFIYLRMKRNNPNFVIKKKKWNNV
ncbi:hypothetical protein HanIR_Chr11g0543621 [Helianthus annuus]|nr:hypothetical protein HanIR_Chr11g0543621 [Helianthus annuus]